MMSRMKLVALVLLVFICSKSIVKSSENLAEYVQNVLHFQLFRTLTEARSLDVNSRNLQEENEKVIKTELDSYPKNHVKFSIDLFDAVLKTTKLEDNIVFSPLIISTILTSKLKELARNESSFSRNRIGIADQIKKILHLENISHGALDQVHKKYTNCVRIHQRSKVLRNLDNQKQLITKQGSYQELLNTAHCYSADWLNNFKKNETFEKGLFYTWLGERKEVPVMTLEGRVPYGYSQDLRTTVMEVPLARRRASLFIFLPDHLKSDLRTLQSNLTMEQLRVLLATLNEHHVSLRLPRFRMSSSLHLTETFSLLGLPDLFEKSSFLRMSLEIQERNPFTTSEMDDSKVPPDVEDLQIEAFQSVFGVKHFLADHPFIFMVWDYINSIVIVMGRVMVPNSVL